MAYLVGDIRQETASVSDQLANKEISRDDAVERLDLMVARLDLVSDGVELLQGDMNVQGFLVGIGLTLVSLLVAFRLSPALRRWLLAILGSPPPRPRRRRK